MKDKYRKALETVALGFSQGNCSIDTLRKACETYKARKGIAVGFDYDVMVMKSCYDYLHGVPQDAEIAKAIVPGQTKVIDGVMYVYSPTKAGSKTQYEWHVVRYGAKTGKAVGRGEKLTDISIQGKQKYVNELFPSADTNLKVIKTLGGSTGAKLVEDDKGNQYVLKKGTNTSSDHVRSEYLANQLYGIMGLRTPDYELYEKQNGEAVLLSRFIPGTHVPGPKDYGKMAEGWVADVLLANWDVYKNDNCLVNDATGKVYRVDNGGSLAFRAQGAKKTFDADVETTWNDMVKYNSAVFGLLSEDEQLKQINAIKKKRADVVNFLKESGEDALADIMDKRFAGLDVIADKIDFNRNKKAAAAAQMLAKSKNRQVKPDAEMYRELTDAEIDKALTDTANTSNISKNSTDILYYKGTRGWDLLANICAARGFDAPPLVVSEKEFWKLRKDTEYPMMFRGFGNNKIAKQYKEDFKLKDKCHYGEYGIWGQGIYTHSDDKSDLTGKNGVHSKPFKDNKSDEHTWKSSPAFADPGESAMAYGGYNEEYTDKFIWAKGAKIANTEDLLDEIKMMGAGSGQLSAKAKQLKDEADAIRAEHLKNTNALYNLEDTIKQQVYKATNYNEQAVADIYDYFDNINWGKRNAQRKRDYPMFDEAVKGRIRDCVKKCGGTTEILNEGRDDESIKISIANSDMYISKYSWNTNAVKQKNAFSPAYHVQAERFKTFMETNYVKPVAEKVQKEIRSGKLGKELQAKIDQNVLAFNAKMREFDDEVKKGGGAGANLTGVKKMIYDMCKNLDYYNSGNHTKSVIGIYAALRGYDGLYQPGGNHGDHGFTVILNRTKVIAHV